MGEKMLIFAIFLVWLSLDFLRANIIMGGEGIGGVQWFVSKSDATRDSIGCHVEYEGGTLEIFTTVEGERPGAMSGLSREGIQHERDSESLYPQRPTLGL